MAAFSLTSLCLFFSSFFYPEVNDDKRRMCFHFIPCENVKCIFASELRLIGSGQLLRSNLSPTMDVRSLSQGLFSHTDFHTFTTHHSIQLSRDHIQSVRWFCGALSHSPGEVNMICTAGRCCRLALLDQTTCWQERRWYWCRFLLRSNVMTRQVC